MVDFDDYSDWIKLYNPDIKTIILDGYLITDDISNPLKWNAKNKQGEPLSAGVYIYSIVAGNFRETKKVILLM